MRAALGMRSKRALPMTEELSGTALRDEACDNVIQAPVEQEGTSSREALRRPVRSSRQISLDAQMAARIQNEIRTKELRAAFNAKITKKVGPEQGIRRDPSMPTRPTETKAREKKKQKKARLVDVQHQKTLQQPRSAYSIKPRSSSFAFIQALETASVFGDARVLAATATAVEPKKPPAMAARKFAPSQADLDMWERAQPLRKKREETADFENEDLRVAAGLLQTLSTESPVEQTCLSGERRLVTESPRGHAVWASDLNLSQAWGPRRKSSLSTHSNNKTSSLTAEPEYLRYAAALLLMAADKSDSL